VIVALPSPFYPATPGLKPERKEDLEARSPRLELIRGWWREAARAETAEVVDLAGTLAPDSRLTGDGVHPTNAGYGRIAARFRDAILGPPAAGHSWNAASTRVARTALKVPESALAKALVWQGVAIDGLHFKPEWTQLGFELIPRYFAGYDPARVKRIYGGDPKFERPKVLCLEGRPAWGGKSLHPDFRPPRPRSGSAVPPTPAATTSAAPRLSR
jgi:hypothetical protein